MDKYRIYIDEVGNADLGSSAKNTNHRYLSLTGVIFRIDEMHQVARDLDNLKQKFFNSHPDDPVILHRKEIINKKYPFKSLLDPIIEANFNEEVLRLFTNWNYQVISVLIDKKEHQERYTTWRHDPYHYCMEILIERFYKMLLDEDAVGDVLIEARGGKEDNRLKKSFTRIYNDGTSYISFEDFQRRLTSKELKVKPKYMNIAGLQIADLLAFPARRYIFKYYQIAIDERETFNEQIIEILKEKFRRRGNRVEGIGFKLLP